MTDAKVAADKVIEVAVGVIYGESRATVLLSSRPEGKVYAGWWEFPGGKLEAGETPAQALVRELREELAIEARDICPWFVMEHVYPHGHVRVHFMRVFAFDTAAGIEALEGQRFVWVDLKGLEAYERLLPMVEIVVRRAFLPDVLLLAGDTVRDWKKALAFALPQSAAVAGSQSLRQALRRSLRSRASPTRASRSPAPKRRVLRFRRRCSLGSYGRSALMLCSTRGFPAMWWLRPTGRKTMSNASRNFSARGCRA